MRGLWYFFKKSVKKIWSNQFSVLLLCPERWQSGRLRRSWKPLSCEAPGVRIPPSPPKERYWLENDICWIADVFAYNSHQRVYSIGGYYMQKNSFAESFSNLYLFFLQGPRGERKGKGVRHEAVSEYSTANPSPLQKNFWRRDILHPLPCPPLAKGEGVDFANCVVENHFVYQFFRLQIKE